MILFHQYIKIKMTLFFIGDYTSEIGKSFMLYEMFQTLVFFGNISMKTHVLITSSGKYR